MKWQFENGIPIYLQILRKMRTEIASGAYPPGGKLPPVRELALEAGVNPNTMQRAFAELERDGLIHNISDAGIVYSPKATYVFVMFFYHPDQLVFDPTNLMASQISNAVYQYFNQSN